MSYKEIGRSDVNRQSERCSIRSCVAGNLGSAAAAAKKRKLKATKKRTLRGTASRGEASSG